MIILEAARRALRRGALLGSVSLTLMTVGEARAQTPMDRPVEFHVSGGDLDHALTQAADQSGVHIFFPSASVVGKKSVGLSGKLTVKQASALSLSKQEWHNHFLTGTKPLQVQLSCVTIECLPFGDVLTRYDRSETLFYLDPPYWGNEDDYGAPFAKEDFYVLLAALERLKGRFVLSINDRPEVRELFGVFNMEAVSVPYTVGGGQKQRPFGELIITN